MKKKQVKALKGLAKTLPKSYELIFKGKIIKGSSISLRDKLKTNIVIHDDVNYKKKEPYIIEINHLNRLKSAFRSNKEQGLFDYILWLDRNNKKMSELFETLETERVNKELINIVKKGVKGFWSNLIAFLFSFFMVFKSESE